jgi:hypothetical protein
MNRVVEPGHALDPKSLATFGSSDARRYIEKNWKHSLSAYWFNKINFR